MFGGKKAKLKEKLIDDPEEVYKFYDVENKPKESIEIQAILNNNNSYKVIVVLDDKNTTIEYLCVKIAEKMEKFQEFENLEGLKAVNLTKKTDKGIIKLPITGEINGFISDGDIIYCDLNTQEYWVKTTIKMNSPNSNLLINLDIKFRLDTMIKKLRFLLMKLGINFWIDYVSNLDDKNHYIFTSLNFKTLKSKNNIEYNVTDLKKGLSVEKKKVSDILDYHSEIIFSLSLISLEELFFNKIKSSSLPKQSLHRLRWDEFRDLTFLNFIANPKFSAEKKFFTNYIKKLIIFDQQQTTKNSFYLYNRNYTVKTHQLIEDDDLNEEDPDKLSSLIILPFDKRNNRETLNRYSTVENNSMSTVYRKQSNEVGEVFHKDTFRTNIVIHKSDMRYYSTNLLGNKAHKNSVCSLNSNFGNNNHNNSALNLVNAIDIDNKKFENEDLISNYTESEMSSHLEGNDHAFDSSTSNNRYTRSFGGNSKMINEFTINIHKEGEFNNLKNGNVFNSDRLINTCYPNKEKDKTQNSFRRRASKDSANNLSIKQEKLDNKKNKFATYDDKINNNFNNHSPYYNEDATFNGIDSSKTIASTQKGCKDRLINKNDIEEQLIDPEDAGYGSEKTNLEEDDRNYQARNNSKINSAPNGDAKISPTSKADIKTLKQTKIPNDDIAANNNFTNSAPEAKGRNSIGESFASSSNFNANYLHSNKELFLSYPLSKKNLENQGMENVDLIKDQMKNHNRYNSSNFLEFDSSIVLNFNKNFKSIKNKKGDYCILDKDKHYMNYDTCANPLAVKSTKPNITHFDLNDLEKEQQLNNRKLSDQSKQGVDLLNPDKFDDPNDTQNEGKDGEKNFRKRSFFNNFRTPTNLVKDLKIVIKNLNLKEELEKFADVKLSKHILERINMPPFRNVQIESKITEEIDLEDQSGKNMDEPLRINHMQILSFLIVLILFFIIAILLIFLLD